MEIRYIFLDLGNCCEKSMCGKDLALTNAPQEVLKSTSKFIRTSDYKGIPAEEAFANKIVESGYEISIIKPIEDIPIHFASADSY